jgi:hypothetical protein
MMAMNKSATSMFNRASLFRILGIWLKRFTIGTLTIT